MHYREILNLDISAVLVYVKFLSITLISIEDFPASWLDNTLSNQQAGWTTCVIYNGRPSRSVYTAGCRLRP